eukprot:scaffold28791_cov22-Tisochrysis_lutea.AAC.1
MFSHSCSLVHMYCTESTHWELPSPYIQPEAHSHIRHRKLGARIARLRGAKLYAHGKHARTAENLHTALALQSDYLLCHPLAWLPTNSHKSPHPFLTIAASKFAPTGAIPSPPSAHNL